MNQAIVGIRRRQLEPFVGCLDQLVIVFESLGAGLSVDFFSRVTFLLIRTCWRAACMDYREGSVGMVHVFENIFAGHGGE